ncbi:MAG TPA: ABC transporter permease subunit [Pirellulales bacterium]|nr:ABC transporter permease subunit [Pirellulales bacterium]
MTRRRNWICAGLLFSIAIVSLMLADERTSRLAVNTLILSASVVALSVPLGSAVGFLLTRTDLPGRRTASLLWGAFVFLPLYVQAGAWKSALDTDGWVTSFVGGSPLLDGWRGAIWVHTAAAVPWVALIVAAGLMLVERDLEEQALLDGSPWWVVRYVTLRRAAGAMGVAALWIALVTAGEMTVTDFFQVRTFAEELYTAAALGDIQPLGGGAGLLDSGSSPLGAPSVWAGIFTSGMMLAMALAMLVALAPMTRRTSVGDTLVFELGRGRWLAGAGMLLLVSLFIALPLASLAWKAGVKVVETPAGRVRSWSALKCLSMVALDPRAERGKLTFRHQREIGWSLAIDSTAATASVAIAAGVAWLARRGTRRAWAGLASVAWLLAVPGPVVGLAIIGLLNRPEIPGFVRLYDRTIAAPCLGCVAHSLPLATLVLWPAMRALPEELIEAAQLEGARLWQVGLYIVLPLRWRVLVLAWIMAFVWSLGELDASVLVAPPGIKPLSNHIFGLLHFGAQDQVAGICLALYLFVQCAMVVAVAVLTLVRGRRSFEVQ